LKVARDVPRWNIFSEVRRAGILIALLRVSAIRQIMGRRRRMETIFDWLTVILFGGLAVLFLQRSSMEEPRDKIWHYIPPAIGCATVNYLGNHGQVYLATAGLVLVMAYIFYVLI
jgi:hypothetical protein